MVETLGQNQTSSKAIGMFAKENIAKDEIFFYLSIEDSLNENSYKNMEISETVNYILPKLGPLDQNFNRILFALMHEMLDPDSFWREWIALLPTKFSRSLFFASKEELKFITGSGLAKRVQSFRKDLEENWKSIQEQMKNKKVSKVLTSAYSKELYIQAALTIFDKAFWVWGKRYLLPNFDLIKCCGDTQKYKPMEVEWNKGQEVWFKSSMPFKAGEEVQVNFGKPNWEYALYHGFVQKNNAQDCVEVPFEILGKGAEDYEEKSKIIREKLLLPSQEELVQSFCIGKKGYMDQKMLKAVGLGLMTLEELRQEGIDRTDFNQREIYEAVWVQLNNAKKLYLTPAKPPARVKPDSRWELLVEYKKEALKNIEFLIEKYIELANKERPPKKRKRREEL